MTRLIDMYLSNEMNATDKAAFESKLASSPKLQEEVKLQQAIMEGANQHYYKNQVTRAKKKYQFNKKLKYAGIALGVLALTTAAILYFNQNNKNTEQNFEVSEELIEVQANLDTEEGIFDLDKQFFQLAGNDTTVISDNGVILSVVEGSFLQNGKPYTGELLMEYTEAMNIEEIMRGGYSTKSNGNLLETQGMFDIKAYDKNGDSLDFNPEIGVYVELPVEENKPGMQLYDSEVDSAGNINWINPTELEKLPILAKMKELDFYPENYEPKLNELKWSTDKRRRDSLYLSFSKKWENEHLAKGKRLFEANCKTCHQPLKDGTGPKLAFVRQKWADAGEQDNMIYQWVQNWKSAAAQSKYAREITKYSSTEMNLFPHLFFTDINQIFDYIDNQSSDAYLKPNLCLSLENNIAIPSRPLNSEEIKAVYNDNRATDLDMSYNEAILVTQSTNTEDLSEDLIPFSSQLNGMNYAVADTIGYTNAIEPPCFTYIDPAKVLAFWKPKFNNTNLSTKDFEKRMSAIHATCQNKVLDIYTKNLDKPIWKLDMQVSKMGYAQFEEFALERVGKIDITDKHQQNLNRLYEKVSKAMQEEAGKNRDTEREKRRTWDKEVQKNSQEHAELDSKRKAQNFKDEYDLNMKEVYKQLGYRKGSVGFKYGTRGPKNVDAQVMELTTKRESGIVTDPFTGKTAKIEYNPLTVSIPNVEEYDKVMFYLFPHKLNSFMRINRASDKSYKEKLNGFMQYDMAIVAFKDDEFFYYQKRLIQPGDYTVELEQMSEKKMSNNLNAIQNSRGIQNKSIYKSEIKWIKKQKANYKEQRRRKAQTEFEHVVARSLFPCYSGAIELPALEATEPFNF